MLRAVSLVALVLALGHAAGPSQAAPPSSAPAEGSSAEYALRSSGGAPDGSYRVVTESTLRLQFTDGAWTGTCSGATTTDSYGTLASEVFERDSPMDPARMPIRLHRGERVDPLLLAAAAEGCRHDLGDVAVGGRTKDGSKQIVATEPDDASAYGGGFEGRLVSASGV